MNRQQLLNKIEQAWAALKESYAGLPDPQLTQPGVIDNWSVKDNLAHVTTWEEEALKYLPLIVEGGTPPRYSCTVRRHRRLQRPAHRGETQPFSLRRADAT